MTRRDFEIRRDLFRKGQIERQRDFSLFRRMYESKIRERRGKRLAMLVAVIIFLIILIFSAYSSPAPQSEYPQEIRFENLDKTL